MATRTLIIDLSKGTGGEPMYGMVTVQRTRATSEGTFEVLPWETKLKLFNGIATITEAVTDGSGPFYDSAYLIRVQNGYCAPRWGFMAALPDGTTPISTGDMPKVNPITGEGIYVDAQEWNSLYTALPDRVTSLEESQSVQDADIAALKALGGLAPGDVNDITTSQLILDGGSLTGDALDTLIVRTVAVDKAYGDGVADATAHIQSRINTAEALGLTVSMPKGRFRLSEALNIPSNTVLKGQGSGTVLDISDVPAGVPSVQAIGSWGAVVPLSVDASQGALTVTVTDASGLAVGDRIKVSSSQEFGATGQPRGEIAQIEAISGNTLTVTSKLMDSYPVTSSGQVEKMFPVRDISLTGLRIEGPQADITKDVVGVSVDTAVRVTLDISARWCHTGGIYLRDVVGYKVDGYHDDALRAGFGYGVAVLWACQEGVIGPMRGTRLRHLITVGGGGSRRGIARGLAVSPSIATQMFDAGFDVHPGGEFITFTGCVVLGSKSDGFVSQGGKVSFVNCVAVDVARHGFLSQNLTIRGLDVTMTGCSVVRAGNRGMTVIPDTSGNESFRVWTAYSIVGGSVIDTVSHGISVENAAGTYHISNINVEGPVVTRAGASGLFFRGTVGATASLSIKDSSATAEALYLNDAPDTSVGGVVDVATSLRGVRVVNSPNSLISGTRIKNPSGTGVMTDALSTGTLVASNKITATTRLSIATGTVEVANA